MNDQPEVDWVESRHRPAPSSDTPSDERRLTCDQCGATETDAAPFAVRGGVAGYFDYCSRACEVAHGSDTPSDERTNAAEDATWACKIGPASRGDLPPGSDAPMRAAVERAFRKLTGHDPEWTFSGWAHDLDEAERAVVEDRLPRPRVIAAAAREQMEQAEAVIGTDLDPEAPERGWEIHEPDDALKITASDDPAPSPTPVPEASGRPGLTLREAAIEAILIREQDTAFSVVARHIAALFTSLDAIPSAPPVPSEGERRPDVRDLPEWEALAEAIATRGELSTLDYRYEDDAIAFRGHLNRPAPSSPPQPDREREVAALAAIVGDLWDYPDGITRPAVYRERLAERFGDDVAKVWDRLRDGCGDETDLDRWHLADRGEQ